MPRAELPEALADEVLAHAAGYPETEVCGLIGGREGTARTVYPVKNVAEEPHRRFAMDPREQIDAMRRMREADETLFAIYHSHPKGPPSPSPTDLREAAYPEALYLIVSLEGEDGAQIRGYRLAGKNTQAVELAMV
jgi:proteasome lid subunit RPN8/RPN11